MKINKYIISALVIIILIIGLVPSLSKSYIDDSLSQKQEELKQNGIILSIKSNNGYFFSTRDIEIKIDNSDKFFEYISDYNSTIKVLNDLTQNGKSIDGLILKGSITNNNICPSDIKARLTLHGYKSDEPTINKLLEALVLNIQTDANGVFETIAIDDITIDDDKTFLQVLNAKIIIDDNNYLSSVENIVFKYDFGDENVSVALNDIKDDLTKFNGYDADEEFTISDVVIKYKTKSIASRSFDYISHNHKSIISSKTNGNNINMVFSYMLGQIELIRDNKISSIDNLIFTMDLKKMNLKAIKKLIAIQDIDNISFQEIEPMLNDIFNQGFSLNTKLDVNNIKNNLVQKFDANIFAFDVTTIIKDNNLSLYDANMMKQISVKGTSKIDENITKLLVGLKYYDTNVTNGISNFDINFNGENLLINGSDI